MEQDKRNKLGKLIVAGVALLPPALLPLGCSTPSRNTEVMQKNQISRMLKELQKTEAQGFGPGEPTFTVPLNHVIDEKIREDFALARSLKLVVSYIPNMPDDGFKHYHIVNRNGDGVQNSDFKLGVTEKDPVHVASVVYRALLDSKALSVRLLK